MPATRLLAACAGLSVLLAVPSLAQGVPANSTDVTQPPGDNGPDSDAARANDAAVSAVATGPGLTVRPEDQAAYDADLAAYRVSLQTARVDAAVAARQERAYADAMWAWRLQVADCRRGVRAACAAPSPRPADFR